MKKALFILILSVGSIALFSQTKSFNVGVLAPMDTTQQIIYNLNGSGITKMGLVVGTDTAWMRWDGTNLNLISTSLLHNGEEIGGGANLGNYSFDGDTIKWGDKYGDTVIFAYHSNYESWVIRISDTSFFEIGNNGDINITTGDVGASSVYLNDTEGVLKTKHPSGESEVTVTRDSAFIFVNNSTGAHNLTLKGAGLFLDGVEVGTGGESLWKKKGLAIVYDTSYNIPDMPTLNEAKVGIKGGLYIENLLHKSFTDKGVYDMIWQYGTERVYAVRKHEIQASMYSGTPDSINAAFAANPDVKVLVIDTIITLTKNWFLPADLTIRVGTYGLISGPWTVTGSNTTIDVGDSPLFNTNVTLAGTWKADEIRPAWFGAVGDGVTDDKTALQKMLDFAKICTYNAITFPVNKSFFISNGITHNGQTNNLVINGNGSELLVDPNDNLSFTKQYVFEINQTRYDTVNLLHDISIGDRTIYVNSTAGLSTGDGIIIVSTQAFALNPGGLSGENYSRGFVTKIEYIVDDTSIMITDDSPLDIQEGSYEVDLTGTSGEMTITGVGGLNKTVTFSSSLSTSALNFYNTNKSAYAAVGVTLRRESDKLQFYATTHGDRIAKPVLTTIGGNLSGTVENTYVEFYKGYSTSIDNFGIDFIDLDITVNCTTKFTIPLTETSVTITVPSGLGWGVGNIVRVYHTWDNYIYGTVTAYNDLTGVLTFTSIDGSFAGLGRGNEWASWAVTNHTIEILGLDIRDVWNLNLNNLDIIAARVGLTVYNANDVNITNMKVGSIAHWDKYRHGRYGVAFGGCQKLLVDNMINDAGILAVTFTNVPSFSTIISNSFLGKSQSLVAGGCLGIDFHNVGQSLVVNTTTYGIQSAHGDITVRDCILYGNTYIFNDRDSGNSGDLRWTIEGNNIYVDHDDVDQITGGANTFDATNTIQYIFRNNTIYNTQTVYPGVAIYESNSSLGTATNLMACDFNNNYFLGTGDYQFPNEMDYTGKVKPTFKDNYFENIRVDGSSVIKQQETAIPETYYNFANNAAITGTYSVVSNVCTVTTSADHNYTTGNSIYTDFTSLATGTPQPSDGSATITVTGATTFTFAKTNGNATGNCQVIRHMTTGLNIDGKEELSINIKAKLTSSSSNQYLLALTSSTGIALWYSSENDEFTLRARTDTTGTVIFDTQIPYYADTLWHNYTVVFDTIGARVAAGKERSADQAFYFYVDGQLLHKIDFPRVGSNGTTYYSFPSYWRGFGSGGNITIATDRTAVNTFKGLISDVAIYDDDLTEEQIKYLYSNPSIVMTNALRVYGGGRTNTSWIDNKGTSNITFDVTKVAIKFYDKYQAFQQVYSSNFRDDGTNVRLVNPAVYQGASGEEVITRTECKSLATGTGYALPTGVNYIGKVWVKETGAFTWAWFDVRQDGTVTLGTDKRGTVGTSSGSISSLNIYDSGSGATIENNLGTTKTVCYKIEY